MAGDSGVQKAIYLVHWGEGDGGAANGMRYFLAVISNNVNTVK